MLVAYVRAEGLSSAATLTPCTLGLTIVVFCLQHLYRRHTAYWQYGVYSCLHRLLVAGYTCVVRRKITYICELLSSITKIGPQA